MSKKGSSLPTKVLYENFPTDKNLMTLPFFTASNRPQNIETGKEYSYGYVFNGIEYKLNLIYNRRALTCKDRDVLVALEYYWYLSTRSYRVELRSFIENSIADSDNRALKGLRDKARSSRERELLTVDDLPEGIRQKHIMDAYDKARTLTRCPVNVKEFCYFAKRTFSMDHRKVRDSLEAMAATTISLRSTYKFGNKHIVQSPIPLLSYRGLVDDAFKGGEIDIMFNLFHFHNLLKKPHSYLSILRYYEFKIKSAARLYEFFKIRLYGTHKHNHAHLRVPYSVIAQYLQAPIYKERSRQKDQFRKALDELKEHRIIMDYAFDDNDFFETFIVIYNSEEFINSEIEKLPEIELDAIKSRAAELEEEDKALYKQLEEEATAFVKNVKSKGSGKEKNELFNNYVFYLIKEEYMETKTKAHEREVVQPDLPS